MGTAARINNLARVGPKEALCAHPEPVFGRSYPKEGIRSLYYVFRYSRSPNECALGLWKVKTISLEQEK